MTPSLSAKEQVLLKRLKLAGFAILVTLFFHALPGRLMQDAWPIIRWSMFSDGFLDYPPEVKTTHWIDVVTTDCQTERVDLNNLLKTSFTSARNAIVKIMADEVFTNPSSPYYEQWKDFLVAQLLREHDLDAASITLVQRDYHYDWHSVPTHDTDDTPLETIVLGTITLYEQSCATPEAKNGAH